MHRHRAEEAVTTLVRAEIAARASQTPAAAEVATAAVADHQVHPATQVRVAPRVARLVLLQDRLQDQLHVIPGLATPPPALVDRPLHGIAVPAEPTRAEPHLQPGTQALPELMKAERQLPQETQSRRELNLEVKRTQQERPLPEILPQQEPILPAGLGELAIEQLAEQQAIHLLPNEILAVLNRRSVDA